MNKKYKHEQDLNDLFLELKSNRDKYITKGSAIKKTIFTHSNNNKVDYSIGISFMNDSHYFYYNIDFNKTFKENMDSIVNKNKKATPFSIDLGVKIN